ncbi:MAG TPA: hypothetical protein VH277_06890 [Gemmatimonadaceae bacterium]|jgi:hypothetical protein|nr:hypothetical protein [Gemmatimonadaceae bacterium]
MKAIAQVAKLSLADVPEIHQLTLPTKFLSGPGLVTAAHAMADAAETYASEFTKHGLPDDFVAQLRAAADEVTESAIGLNLTKANTTSATSGIRAQEQRVRTLLKMLNALIVPKLGTDVTLISKWRVARAIDHQSPIVPVPASIGSPAASAPAVGATGTTPAGSTTPASTTPAATSPVSTTPAATPPVSTPPASTPPAQ